MFLVKRTDIRHFMPATDRSVNNVEKIFPSISPFIKDLNQVSLKLDYPFIL